MYRRCTKIYMYRRRVNRVI